MTLPKLLTVDEVAKVTRAPRSTVFHWIYTDKLRSRRVGKRRLIVESDLIAFIDSSLPDGRRRGGGGSRRR